MSFKKLIKRFRFSTAERDRFDLSGGLRINKAALEVPPVIGSPNPTPQAAVYNVSQTLTAATWIAHPRAVKAWLGFAIELKAPKLLAQDAPSPLYGIQFRLHDGANARWFDGVSWEIATLITDWNTLAEVSTNIPTFPLAAKKLGVVVNMWTNDERVTPKLISVRVLYEADLSEEYDIIYGSLVPELKASIRPRGRVGYRMPANSDEIDLSDTEALGFDTGYTIASVTAAYNETSDPERILDIVDSFNTNTKVLTLTESVPTGEVLWVEFQYAIPVVAQTSSDYYEISSIPRIAITNVQQINTQTERFGYEDSVIDINTGVGWKVQGPRLAELMVDIEVLCDKQHDVSQVVSSLMDWITNNPFFTMRGPDEQFQIQLATGLATSSDGSLMNRSKSTVSFLISNVAFFNRPAIAAYSVNQIVFGGAGNLNIEVLPG
jgi:hypothetical protein